jgi:hypothetical protein
MRQVQRPAGSLQRTFVITAFFTDAGEGGGQVDGVRAGLAIHVLEHGQAFDAQTLSRCQVAPSLSGDRLVVQVKGRFDIIHGGQEIECQFCE